MPVMDLENQNPPQDEQSVLADRVEPGIGQDNKLEERESVGQ